MGLQDRDYLRERPVGGVGRVRLWSVTTWLIALNVGVFVVDAFVTRLEMERGMRYGVGRVREGWLESWGSFSIDAAFGRGELWRLITFQFLHAGVWHLVVNMVGLWMFGPVVELNLGTRRYAFFYFLCGMAGPVMYAVLWGLGVVMPAGDMVNGGQVPLVGASAGIFGVLLAAAYLSPDRPVNVYFMDVPLKYLAWILMGFAGYVVLVNGGNAGGQAAHLGGGLLGWFLIRHERWLDVVARKKRVRGRKVKDWSRDFNR